MILVGLGGRTSGTYLFHRDRGHWEQQTVVLPGVDMDLSGRTAIVGNPNEASIHELGPAPQLHCPGDIDGDAQVDLVLVGFRQDVTVKAQDGRLITSCTSSSLAGRPAMPPAESELVEALSDLTNENT